MSSDSIQTSTDSTSTRGTVDPAAQRSASSEPAATAGTHSDETADSAESSNVPPTIKITGVETAVSDVLSKAQFMSDESAATLKRRAEAATNEYKADYNSLMGRSGSQSPSPPGSEPTEEEMEEVYISVMEAVVPESTPEQRSAVALTLSKMEVLKRRKIEVITDDDEENDSGEGSNASAAEGDDDTAAGDSSGGTQA